MTTPKEIKSRFHSRRKDYLDINSLHSSVESSLSTRFPASEDHKSGDVTGLESAMMTMSEASSSILPKICGSHYIIHFQPGAIGLKLEPVIKNRDGKEFGCRVMDFVDLPSKKISQARASGKIKIGDIFTSVDGRNVTSKSYVDIVKILTESSNETGRKIGFRVPKSPPVLSTYHGTLQDSTKDQTSAECFTRYTSEETNPDDMTFFSPSYNKMTPLLEANLNSDKENKGHKDAKNVTKKKNTDKSETNATERNASFQLVMDLLDDYEIEFPSSEEDKDVTFKSHFIDELRHAFERIERRSNLKFEKKKVSPRFELRTTFISKTNRNRFVQQRHKNSTTKRTKN